MKVNIQDAQTLWAIRAEDAAAYLRGHGWKHTETLKYSGTVWKKMVADKGEAELLLLMDSSMDEYARRMSEVIKGLEIVEQRSQLDIVRDIMAVGNDVLRIGLQHGLIENGAVPLDYAIQMVKQTRDVLLAAACAAVSPYAVYSSRKPARALEYVRGLRMGQTEQGSFVITLQSPVPPYLQVELDTDDFDFYDETPFERQVFLTLSGALAAVNGAVKAAASSGAFAPFTEAIPSGVSANLCYALSTLGMDDTAESVTIGLTWSPTRPTPPDVPTQFRFGRETFPALREAARLLRASDRTPARPLRKLEPEALLA